MNKANRAIHLMSYQVKEKFYQVKKQLLSKKGIPDGCDWQHIPGKKCWSCYNGVFTHYSGTKDTCYKCAGTGWFVDPRYILLQRYKYKNQIFHIPIKSTTINSKHWQIFHSGEGQLITGTIEGYIYHEPPKNPHLHVWLFLLQHAFWWTISCKGRAMSLPKPQIYLKLKRKYHKYKLKQKNKKALTQIHNTQFDDDLPF